MTDTLDNILSGSSEAAPETPVVEEAVTQVADGESQQEQTTEAEQPEGQETTAKMVPHEALHAEKQKVKRYTEEVADFRKSNESLQRQVAELLQRIPVPKAEQEQDADFYADPDAAVQQRLGRALDPLANTVSTIQTQLVRLAAVQTHGAEKVTAFEKYVEEAMAKGDPEMATLGAQMRASADPIKTGLDWLEKRTFDPEKERERIKAELLAELNPAGQQEEQTQQRVAPVMPSNFSGVRNAGSRSGPAWSGPPTLNDIFSMERPGSGG